MALNLNSLIMSDGDEEASSEPPLLIISNVNVHNSPPVEQNSDSDSSYSEFAKETSRNMKNMIDEISLKISEKNFRINQARNQKAKELEEKQRSFKGGGQYDRNNQRSKNIKTFHNSKPDMSSKNHFKTSENNRVQNVSGSRKYSNSPSTSKINYSNKEGECDIIANKNATSFSEPKKPQKNVISSSNSGNIPDSDLSSKLRNVTLQEFDIDSTDSSDYESDDSSNNLSDHEQLKGRLKLFTTKNLNRGAFEIIDVDNKMESSEDDSDSDDDPVMKPKGMNTGRSYWSAEKSSAVQKRKRSNYLKKRDFRHNQKLLKKDKNVSVFDESSLQNHQLDGNSSFKNEMSTSNKQSGVTSDVNTSPVKMTNCKQRNSQKKPRETTDVQSYPEKITDKNINHKGFKRHNYCKDNEIVDGTKPNIKIKKNDESSSCVSNFSAKSPSTSKENTKIDRIKDKNISSFKTKKNERKDYKLRDKLKGKDMDEETLIKTLNQRIIVKNRSDGLENLKSKSIDDIDVLSEVYLIKKDPSNSGTAQVKTVENVMDSIMKTPSDDEIGVSLFKCTQSETLKMNFRNSASESDDVDFNTILKERENRSEKRVAVSENSGSELNSVKAIEIPKEDGESSSDYEAEFEACLTNTKLKYSANLKK